MNARPKTQMQHKRHQNMQALLYTSEGELTGEAQKACALAGLNPTDLINTNQRKKIQDHKLYIVTSKLNELKVQGNSPRLQKLSRNHDERAIKSALLGSKIRCQSQGSMNGSDQLTYQLNMHEKQARNWNRVKSNQEMNAQIRQNQVRKSLSKEFKVEKNILKQKRMSIQDKRTEVEKKANEWNKVLENRQKKMSDFTQRLKDFDQQLKVKQEKALHQKQLTAEKRSFSAKQSMQRSPSAKKQFLAFGTPDRRDSLTSLNQRSTDKMHMSNYSIQMQRVREEQTQQFLKAKRDLEAFQMRLDVAQTRRNLRSTQLQEHISRRKQEETALFSNRQNQDIQNFHQNFQESVQHRLKTEKRQRDQLRERKEDLLAEKNKRIQKQEQVNSQRLTNEQNRQKRHQQNLKNKDRHSQRENYQSGLVEKVREFHSYRNELHQMNFDRRRQIHLMHKEILVNSIIDKQNRTDNLSFVKDKLQQNQRQKNIYLRDMAIEMRHNQKQSLAATALENHREEWKQECQRLAKIQRQQT